MDKFKEGLRNEIREFRETGIKFLNREVSVADFKKTSGGMGVYAERGGKKFMMRLRMPSGIISEFELNKICELAEKYKLQNIHLTTRQAIQLHTMEFEDICNLMEECLDYNIFTRGVGGSYPRNVAVSPLAGVDKDEAFDVTDISLKVNNYFLERICSYKLPRKLKISFSGTGKDKVYVPVQDLGFVAVNKDGKKTFTVYAGGGLGMNPRKAVFVEEGIDPAEVLYYVEGMIKFFMAEGDYKVKARARVRYILERMGEEEFVKEYKKYVEAEKLNSDLKLDIEDKEIIKKGIKTELHHKRLYPQKQEGLYSVYIHPLGGNLMVEDLKTLCDFIKGKEDVEVRLAMEEAVYIRNLNGKEAEELLEITEKFSENLEVMQSISCIGLPKCQMGRCNSQGLLEEIISYLKEKGYHKDVLPRVHISGCPNSCSAHEIAEIGFMGIKVRHEGEFKEAFKLVVDGKAEIGDTKLAVEKNDFLPERIPEFIYELSNELKAKNIKFEEYINNYEAEFDALAAKYSV